MRRALEGRLSPAAILLTHRSRWKRRRTSDPADGLLLSFLVLRRATDLKNSSGPSPERDVSRAAEPTLLLEGPASRRPYGTRMIPSKTNASADVTVNVTIVPLGTGTPRQVRARASVLPSSARVPPPAEKVAFAAGPVVGPPTTQTSLASRGIVNVSVPF